MEKFGLFDLLEKLGGSEPEKRAQTKNENPTHQSGGAADISGTPPQLKMNDKFKDFIARHDAAAAAVRTAYENEKHKAAQKNAPKSSAAKKRGRPEKTEKSVLTENTNGGAVINAGKKRGRPEKTEKSALTEEISAKAAVPVQKKRETLKSAEKTGFSKTTPDDAVTARKKRARAQKSEKSVLPENINGGAVINAGKKRGRPKKSEKSTLTEEISAKAAVPVQKKRETLKSTEKTGFPKTTPDDAVTARKKREGQKKCSCGAKKTVGN